MRAIIGAAVLALMSAAQVQAAPGVGDPIYGATVEKGLTEFEARYGRLTGGLDDGSDGLVLEAEHGFSKRFAGAVLIETGRDIGGPRRVDALALEGIYTLGTVRGVAVAVYGEYKHGLHGDDDAAELKLLFEHRAHAFDARLNLIGATPFARAPTAFGYAASADWAVVGDEVRVGGAAFGEFGSSRRLGGATEHFAGPEVKVEIEHLGRGELEVEAGWLRAFGAARERADGQARLLVSYEVHF